MNILKYFFPKSKINLYNQLKYNNFAQLSKGDIILIKSYSLFGKIIRIKSTSDSGNARYNHAERYIDNGKCISQQWTVRIHNLKRYFHGKHNISVWHNKTYTNDQRDCLITSALHYVDRSYDWISVVGHFLDWLLRLNYFAKKFNFPHKTNCSEFVTLIEKLINSTISYKPIEQTTPDDIYDYISNHPDWIKVYSF